MSDFTDVTKLVAAADPECVCRGNWRNILKECRPLMGRVFIRDGSNDEWRFFGLVDGDDDYYYGMMSVANGSVRLLSCVGSFEGHGYSLIREPK